MCEIIFWGGTGLAKVLNEAISNTDFTLTAIFDNHDIPSPLPPLPLHVGQAGFDAWFKARGGIAAKALWFSFAVGAKGRDRGPQLRTFPEGTSHPGAGPRKPGGST